MAKRRTDKERLDFLSRHKATAFPEEGLWCCNGIKWCKTIRQAIDAAMSQEAGNEKAKA